MLKTVLSQVSAKAFPIASKHAIADCNQEFITKVAQFFNTRANTTNFSITILHRHGTIGISSTRCALHLKTQFLMGFVNIRTTSCQESIGSSTFNSSSICNPAAAAEPSALNFSMTGTDQVKSTGNRSSASPCQPLSRTDVKYRGAGRVVEGIDEASRITVSLSAARVQ